LPNGAIIANVAIVQAGTSGSVTVVLESGLFIIVRYPEFTSGAK
jgi:hypothetical protein